jgi:hypothetical protein
MNADSLDLPTALNAVEARFLVVGAYAVGVHGRPRATKDLDVWMLADAGYCGLWRTAQSSRTGAGQLATMHMDRFACASRSLPAWRRSRADSLAATHSCLLGSIAREDRATSSVPNANAGTTALITDIRA